MRRRRRMADQALGVAEIVRDVDDLERVEKAEGGVLAAGDAEGDEGTAALHLARGERGLRMAGKARIGDRRDLGMRLEESGELGGIARLLRHPEIECLQPLQEQPGIERAERRAGVAQERRQLLGHEIAAAENGAAEAAALAVDMLGR